MAGYSKLSDVELISRIAGGDREAFRMIYDSYRNKVYAVALKVLRQPMDAEEVMQEVMLKLWLSAKDLKADSNLEAYLRTLTRNFCYNMLRRQALEAKTAISRGKNWQDFSNETQEQLLLSETRKVILDAVNRLPPQQKMVYELCQQEGLKYEEAAQRMNLSTYTVQGYMKLALRSVRSYVALHTDVAAIAVIFGLLKK